MVLSIGELVGYVDLDTSAGEGAVSKFSSLLGKAGGTWGTALAGAGAAGGLIFAGSLAGALNTDAANDKLAASLGLTEKQAETSGKVAGKVYSAGWGESAEDVNTALQAVMSSIKGMRNASEKDLQTATTSALVFSSAMGVDVTKAASTAGNMINNGLAKNAVEAFDLLTKASQKVPAELKEDVLDATNEYGQFFTKLGIDGPTAMGLLAAGAEKGMYGIDKAGDAVKEFTIRSTDMSASSKAAYDAIGLDAGKMANSILAGGDKAKSATDKIVSGILGIKDPAAQANTAIALFGTPLEDLGTKDIPKFLKSLQSGEDGLGKWKGATKAAGDTMTGNAQASLNSFTRTIKTKLVTAIGGQAVPVINDMAASLNDNLGPAFELVGKVVEGVTGFLQDHSTTAKSLSGVTAALTVVTLAHNAAMAVGAAGGMVKWLQQTKLISSATKVWAAVQWAMNAALAANPIGLVVLALAAVAIGLVVAYKKSETFRDIVNGAFGAVQGVVGGVADFFTEKIPAAMDWVVQKGKQWGPYLLAAVLPIVGVPLLIAKHWDSIKAKTTDLIGKTVGWFTALPGRIGGGLSSLGSTVVGRFRDAMQAARERAVAIGGNILDYYLSMPGRIGNKLGGVVGTIRGLFHDAMVAGKEKVTGIGGDIREWIAGIPAKLESLGGRFGSAGRGLLQDFINGMKNAAGIISGIAGNVWDTVRGLLNGAITKINAALEFSIKVGPKSFGVNPPDIPHLATGGRATADTLAVIGDGREPESVLPDSMLRGLLERVHAAGAASAADRDGGRNAPLIGTVVQAPGESDAAFAERLWFLLHSRG